MLEVPLSDTAGGRGDAPTSPATGSRFHSTADRAVDGVLRRIQIDPDFRWVFLHTEPFRLLCQAEAERTGESPECVADRRSVDLQPRHRRRSARLPAALRALEAFASAARLVLARFGPAGLSVRGEGLLELQDALEAFDAEGGRLS